MSFERDYDETAAQNGHSLHFDWMAAKRDKLVIHCEPYQNQTLAHWVSVQIT
jgi:hypothetical protein